MSVLPFDSSYSHSATVIASENHDPSNKTSVLFDLMSHTLTGCVQLIMNSLDSLLVIAGLEITERRGSRLLLINTNVGRDVL